MIDYDFLSQKLLRALPPHLKAIEEDIQQQFKTILSRAFAQLDIVTREEFDVQTKVLARTREKVDALETQLKKLIEEKNV